MASVAPVWPRELSTRPQIALSSVPSVQRSESESKKSAVREVREKEMEGCVVNFKYSKQTLYTYTDTAWHICNTS